MPHSIINAIFPVIAYLCIGYIAKRTKKFDPANSGILIGYALNISIPCMIVLDMIGIVLDVIVVVIDVIVVVIDVIAIVLDVIVLYMFVVP